MQRNQDRANLAASLRELAELGSSVDLSAADTEDELADIEIEQVGGIIDSTIFELPSSLVGYMVSIVVTNHTSRTIYCRDVELRSVMGRLPVSLDARSARHKGSRVLPLSRPRLT